MSAERSGVRRWLPGARVVAPIAILLAGVFLVLVIHASQGEIPQRPPDTTAPLIRTIVVEPEDFRFYVEAQGTVAPRRESELIPQVSGEVVWVSPDVVTGGFFEEGQPLIRIDRADYDVGVESARAAVARAESEFARAEKDRNRQRRLADRSVASEARIDDAENAFRVARAVLRESRAQLERAERDLARTEISAPYKGRVRSEQVDVGQFANRGTPLAKLYAVDYAEVRLPLPDRELAFLDLDLALTGRSRDVDARGAAAGAPSGAGDAADLPDERRGPKVRLRARFAGEEHEWQGWIVRTEGEIDPKSRMVHVVARVEDPYGTERPGDSARPPLAVGLFVTAEIEGRWVEDAYVLPRSALRRARGREESQVMVVDEHSRIDLRDVEVLRTEHERVIIGDGLAPGERVSVSPLRVATDGMRVRVAGDLPPGPDRAGADT